MKNLKFILFVFAIFSIIACGGSKTKSDENNTGKTEQTDETSDESTKDNTKIYKIKSGHLVYKTTMDMTIDTWFDDYGNKQYTVSSMEMFGEKSGTYSYIIDGYKYDYNIGSTEGTKMPYYASATTDYDDVSAEDIKKYGIEMLGNETIAGKDCQVVSIKSPIASKVWIWEGIPMKTVSKLGKEDFIMEISEIETGDVDAGKFELPEGVTFSEY